MFNTADTSVKKYYEETSYGNLSINSVFYPITTSSTILTYRDEHNASYIDMSNIVGNKKTSI